NPISSPWKERLPPGFQSRSEAGCLGGACALSNVLGTGLLGAAFGRFMRFTSLVVELIRARPRLVVWIVVLVQAGLWLFLPMLLYRSPPGDGATVVAYGREQHVGPRLRPPSHVRP